MRSLVGITLLAGYTAAQAQDYGRYRDDDRYYDRDDRGYRRGGGFFVDRVQTDLNYAESCAYSRGELKADRERQTGVTGIPASVEHRKIRLS